eukprot:3173990-Pyramimonas_sp.AAC.1
MACHGGRHVDPGNSVREVRQGSPPGKSVREVRQGSPSRNPRSAHCPHPSRISPAHVSHRWPVCIYTVHTL